jgi:hypothetical protein
VHYDLPDALLAETGIHALPLKPHTRRFDSTSQTKDPVTSQAVTNLHNTLPGGLTASSLSLASQETVEGCINKVGFWRRKTEYIQSAAQMILKGGLDEGEDLPEGTEDGWVGEEEGNIPRTLGGQVEGGRAEDGFPRFTVWLEHVSRELVAQALDRQHILIDADGDTRSVVGDSNAGMSSFASRMIVYNNHIIPLPSLTGIGVDVHVHRITKYVDSE